MIDSRSKAALVLIFAALFTSALAAQAEQVPTSTASVPDEVLQDREVLKNRLDAAARSVATPILDGDIAQWYNSRFSKSGFSNW